MDKESLMKEIFRLKKVVRAYEDFESEIEYAFGKVRNDRIESALEDLQINLNSIHNSEVI